MHAEGGGGDPAVAGDLLQRLVQRAELGDLDPTARLVLLDRARELGRVAGGAAAAETRARVEYRRALTVVALGRLREAREDLAAAIERFPTASGHRPLLLHARADVAWRQGDFEAALELLAEMERAEQSEVVQAYPDFARVLSFHRRRLAARTYAALGVPDVAAALLAELRSAAAAGGPELVRVLHLERALYDIAVEQFEHALGELEEVLGDEAEVSGATAAQARFLRGAALTHLEREDSGRAPRAAADLRAALDSGALSSNEALTAELLLADLALRRRDFDAASARLREAEERMGAVRAEQLATRPFEERTQLAALRARLAREAGLELSEQRRALELLRDAYDDLLREWEHAPRRPGGIGFLHPGSRRAILSELIEQTLRVEGDGGLSSAFEAVLRAGAMGSLARELGLAPGNVRDVRDDVLQPGHGVLVYLPATDRTHVFVLTDERLDHHRLPRKSELLGPAGEFAAELLRRPSTDAGRLAQYEALREQSLAVSRLLLPDEVRDPMYDWKAVTIVGADLLANVPFEALRWGRGFLGEAFAVDNLPSLCVGGWLASRHRRFSHGERELFLLTCLDPGEETVARFPEVRPLAFGESDVHVLTRHHFRSGWRALHDARRDDLLGADLREYAVVHLLSHGVYDYARERGAGLALADGTLVWCDDLRRDMFSGVVLLTACGTALGPDRLGDDGLSNLGGAVLRAGATAVVLSRGRMEYSGSLGLMSRVGEGLKAGLSPAEALRRARSRTAGHPILRYYQAQVQVVGLGHRPTFKGPSPVVLALSGRPLPGPYGRGAEHLEVALVVTTLALGGFALAWLARVLYSGCQRKAE